jgi:hypothetical protein
MRWGFGRGGSARRRADGEAGDPPSGPRHSSTEQQSSDQHSQERRGLEWRRLPPLGPTVAARPVLVSGSLMKLPDVTGTRPLIHRPTAVPVHDAASGRVSGVVVPRSTDADSAGTPTEPTQQQAAKTPVREPVVARRRWVAHARPASAERRVLVSVSDEFVGEPQPEETPYASSAWLRMVQAYRPQQQIDAGDAAASMPALPSPTGLSPDVVSPGALSPDQLGFSRSEDGATLSWSSSAMPPPLRKKPAADPSSSPSDSGAEPPRRASLAESRRLGLGQPLPHGRPRADRNEQSPERSSAADRDARPDPPRSTPMPNRPDHSVAAAPASPFRPAAPEADDLTPAPRHADVNQGPELPAAPRGFGLGAPIAKPAVRRPGPAAEQRDRGTATPQAPLFHAAAAREARPEQPESPAPATHAAPSNQNPQTPARPAVSAPVYRASFRRPAPSATAAEFGRPEASELIHRSAPAPKDSDEEPQRPQAAEPAPPEPSRAEPEPPAPPLPVFEPPRFAPHELADALRRLHGVDVSDVPINRGPETTAEARALDARAFTRDGEVFLPPGEGPFERPGTRALLAHELTHAAQQRAFGPSLPSEDSPAGRALEAEAHAAEHSAREHSHVPLTHFPLSSSAFGVPGPQLSNAGRTQRAPEDLFEAPLSWNPFAHNEQQQAGTESAPAPRTVQEAWSSPQEAAPEPDPELAAARGRLLELADQRLLDLDDQMALGELAEGLYPRIRLRLQHELLVARERTGTLSDLR